MTDQPTTEDRTERSEERDSSTLAVEPPSLRRHKKKEEPEIYKYQLPSLYEEWNCGWENITTEDVDVDDIHKDIRQSWGEFIEEIYEDIPEEWEDYKRVFNLRITPSRQAQTNVPSKETLRVHRRVDHALFEVMRINKLLPKKVSKQFLANGYRDGRYFKVYRTWVEFVPQRQKARIASDQYPDIHSIKKLLKSFSANVYNKPALEVESLLPGIHIEVHELLKDREISVNLKGTSCDALNEIASQLQVEWEWVGYINGKIHICLLSPKQEFIEPPIRLSTPPSSIDNQWFFGLENLDNIEFDYFELMSLYRQLTNIEDSTGRKLEEAEISTYFIETLMSKIKSVSTTIAQNFEIYITNPEQNFPTKFPDPFGSYRSLDRWLLECMRLNEMTPKVSKEFVGYGKSGGKTYSLYRSKLQFSPQKIDRILTKTQYPSLRLIEHLLHEYHLDTTARAPEDKTFESIARELPKVYIELPDCLKEQVIEINIQGTLCEIFNALALVTGSEWEWKERVLVQSHTYGRIYFSPSPLSSPAFPLPSEEGKENEEYLDWHLGWEDIRAKQFGYFQVVSVARDFQSRGWLDLIHEVYDELSLKWGSRSSEDCMALSLAFKYPEGKPNRVVSLSRPRSFRRLDQFLLEISRLNKLVPTRISKEFVGYGRSEDKRYRVYKTILEFSMQYRKEVMAEQDYPEYEQIYRMLQPFSIDTTQRVPSAKTLEVLCSELASLLAFETLPAILKNLVINIKVTPEENLTLCDFLNKLTSQLDAVWEWTGKEPYGESKLARIKLIPREDLIKSCVYCDDLS